jgi:hypothetical protein
LPALHAPPKIAYIQAPNPNALSATVPTTEAEVNGYWLRGALS